MPVVTTSLTLFVSGRPFSLDSSMSKELFGRQNTSETVEASAYTVWYWIGSIVPGSMEPLLERALFIDSCELERRFVIEWRPMF